MTTDLERSLKHAEVLAERFVKQATSRPLVEVILAAGYFVHSVGASTLEQEIPEDATCYDGAVDALVDYVYSAAEGDLGEALVILGLAIGKMAVTAEDGQSRPA